MCMARDIVKHVANDSSDSSKMNKLAVSNNETELQQRTGAETKENY